jgi:hypothetical protein
MNFAWTEYGTATRLGLDHRTALYELELEMSLISDA